MIKRSIFESEQNGVFMNVKTEIRFYKTFNLYSGDAVVEFSDKGIAIYEDYENDERFITLEEFKDQFDETMERELKLFLYYVEDGHDFSRPYEEIVDDKIFKEMMQTFMLYQAISQSANQYHWMKLLLKRTKQTRPTEEEGNRGDFDSLIALYLPEWEELYTGGGISLMLRDFKASNGETILVILSEMGASVILDEENGNKPISKSQYKDFAWEETTPLVYQVGDAKHGEVLAQSIFEYTDVNEIIEADKTYQRICE